MAELVACPSLVQTQSMSAKKTSEEIFQELEGYRVFFFHWIDIAQSSIGKVFIDNW